MYIYIYTYIYINVCICKYILYTYKHRRLHMHTKKKNIKGERRTALAKSERTAVEGGTKKSEKEKRERLQRT